MIITDQQFYQRFSFYSFTEYKTRGESLYCRNININKTPTIFNDSNIKNPDIINSLRYINDTFSSLWLPLEKYISAGEASYRDTPTKYLTLEEAIILESDLKYKGDKGHIIDKGICIKNKIRVFVAKDLDINYHIIDYTYKNNYDNSNMNMISIFIGSKFYEDEYNYLRLIYSLSSCLIKIKLQELGVPFNKILNNGKIIDTVVLNRTSYEYNYGQNVSDAIFVAEYYTSLFVNIINSTNNNIISNYKDICDKLYDINIAEDSYNFKTLEEIWNYAFHVCSNEETDTEFNSICSRIYSCW